MEQKFKVGDRLRSLRSGLIWIVSDTDAEPPVCFTEHIPVRKVNWPSDRFCWIKTSIFEKAY